MKNKTKKIIIIIAVIALAFVVFLVSSKPAASVKESGVQIIQMTESANGYIPNTFTIKKGIPVRWEIEASSDRTCASALLVPDYQIRAFLTPGKNVIEFTPQTTGEIGFSCSMKMFTGTFNVIE